MFFLTPRGKNLVFYFHTPHRESRARPKGPYLQGAALSPCGVCGNRILNFCPWVSKKHSGNKNLIFDLYIFHREEGGRAPAEKSWPEMAPGAKFWPETGPARDEILAGNNPLDTKWPARARDQPLTTPPPRERTPTPPLLPPCGVCGKRTLNFCSGVPKRHPGSNNLVLVCHALQYTAVG